MTAPDTNGIMSSIEDMEEAVSALENDLEMSHQIEDVCRRAIDASATIREAWDLVKEKLGV